MMQREWFCNKKVLVVGLGISGFESVRWLCSAGAEVLVTDVRPLSEIRPEYLYELEKAGIGIQAGASLEAVPPDTDMVVISPGVPPFMKALKTAVERGIPVIGELELAYRVIDTPIIAVTGTNGKTTVTSLIGRLLDNAGIDAFVGGNIGTPLVAYAHGNGHADYAVTEVSSFQLETAFTFKPFISVILNVSPDHLERHGSFDAYMDIKLRIYRNQGPGQHVIVNDDDENLKAVNITSGAVVHRYGFVPDKTRHAFIDGHYVHASTDGTYEHVFSLERCKLLGRHNQENILAAVICGLILGIRDDVIQSTIDGFSGLPNRLERVAEKDGIVFYNDSKATNIDSAIKAVMTLDPPIILIAGGRHKGADYGPLEKACRGRVKTGIFLGEAGDALLNTFKNRIPAFRVNSMEEAVRKACACASCGDTVLLSPACASFDMFSDYVHRARVFVDAVKKVVNG